MASRPELVVRATCAEWNALFFLALRGGRLKAETTFHPFPAGGEPSPTLAMQLFKRGRQMFIGLRGAAYETAGLLAGGELKPIAKPVEQVEAEWEWTSEQARLRAGTPGEGPILAFRALGQLWLDMLWLARLGVPEKVVVNVNGRKRRKIAEASGFTGAEYWATTCYGECYRLLCNIGDAVFAQAPALAESKNRERQQSTERAETPSSQPSLPGLW